MLQVLIAHFALFKLEGLCDSQTATFYGYSEAMQIHMSAHPD